MFFFTGFPFFTTWNSLGIGIFFSTVYNTRKSSPSSTWSFCFASLNRLDLNANLCTTSDALYIAVDIVKKGTKSRDWFRFWCMISLGKFIKCSTKLQTKVLIVCFYFFQERNSSWIIIIFVFFIWLSMGKFSKLINVSWYLKIKLLKLTSI